MTLEETLQKIHPLDEKAMEISRKRWDVSLNHCILLKDGRSGRSDRRGITGSPDMNLKKRALVAMCADNGVVEEGVTQTGQEVTAIVAENFLTGDTSCLHDVPSVRTDVYPVECWNGGRYQSPDRSQSCHGYQKYGQRTGNDKRRNSERDRGGDRDGFPTQSERIWTPCYRRDGDRKYYDQ